ncbi:hypothetical protein VTO42DRAFT_8068 [Malbranchea cinnamomea]
MEQETTIETQGNGGPEEINPGSWNPACRPETCEPDRPVSQTPPTPPSPQSFPSESQPRHHEDETPPSSSENGSSNISTTENQPSHSELSGPVPVTHPQPNGDEPQVTEVPQTGCTSPDPFKQLQSVTRSNTFPEIDFDNETMQTQSQDGRADDNFQRIEDADTIQQSSPDRNDGPFHDTDLPLPSKPTSLAGDDDDGYSFFAQVSSQTKPIYSPSEAESRFEEGVPLVNNADISSPADVKGRASLDEIFEQDDAAAEDAGFFSANLGTEPSKDPEGPTLNRKSTSQILGSLNFDGGSRAIDSPVEGSTTNAGRQEAETVNANGPAVSEEVPADDLEARWKAALGDDDLLLLEDEEPLPETIDAFPQSQSPPDGTAGHLASPAPYETTQPSSIPFQPQNGTPIGSFRTNIYTPHQPSSSDLVAGLPTPLYDQPSQSKSSESPVEKPVSYVNQSKAGYQSPYDLPDDIRPKRTPIRRAPAPQPAAVSSIPPPPPRNSSMTGTRPTSSSSTIPPPSLSQHPHATDPTQQTIQKPSSGSSNFFEELPAPSRSRPSTRGRYTPQPAVSHPAPATAVPSAYSPPRQPTSTFDPPQLQNPQRVGPCASLPASVPHSAPVQSSRYSPKPTSLETGSRFSSPRYPPVPPPQPGPSNKYMPPPSNVPSYNNVLPFQPRTSSPLAQHGIHPATIHPQVGSTDGAGSGFHAPPRSPPSQVAGDVASRNSSPESRKLRSPPPNRHTPQQPPAPSHPDVVSQRLQQHVGEPAVSAYTPMSQSAPSSQIPPPKRSMTQSPTKRVHNFNQPGFSREPIPRPASVQGTVVPAPSNNCSTVKPVVSHNTPQLEFIPPTDGQELDPLERWKGAPIFKFGFGGTILSSFPKHVPRYAAGHVLPKLKANPGEVKTRQFGAVVIDPESVPKFPGPLRSKSKKKDVLSWLSAMISSFEEELRSGITYQDQAAQQHLEEKILLWKVIRELVNHDGVLEGSSEISNSIRGILLPMPQLTGPESQAAPLQADSSTVYVGATRTANAEPTSVVGLENIRTHLLSGDREKAVWEAVDHRLWGHAMLLSSTLDSSVWKQVSQEFIRREVRSIGEDNEPLAALYEIFAGNAEESVDELVPVSARAGLQFVSRNTGTGPAKNALDGLNKWRETLTLILSNRNSQDRQALLALSRLLGSYGRTEASHICALFARTTANPVVGGIHEPHSAIVLLGVDHHHHPFTFVNDRNSWLLTEVYEFAVSVLAGYPSSILPHLQPFKLQYAKALAEEGHKTTAQEYCDSIGAVLKSTSKSSPYYHQAFCSELDELASRLRQAPSSDGSSSWISKPSMEKVSGSMWAKFSSFVTGEDSDGGSTGSGKAADSDLGPFAKMIGTPPISRSPSVADSYFIPTHQHSATMPSTSRYVPRNQSTSPDQSRMRRSLDSQRSASYGTLGYSYPLQRQSQDPFTPVDGPSYQVSTGPIFNSPPSSVPQQQNYSPLAPVEEAQTPSFTPSGDAEVSSDAPAIASHYQPTQVAGQQPTTESPYSQTESGYVPPSQSTYEPPTGTTGYEPPSYEPESPEDDAEEDKPKKKSFMDDDDDDDIMARAEQIKQSERERRNREAAELVRKAAEEDAKRAQDQQAEKGGWFSWLRGGKKEQTNAPIRAKLGEKNSFYYDNELKRWVNKKDPSTATPAAHATPPPPKGPAPPSRSAASTAPPPPSSTGSPAPPTLNGNLAPPPSSSPSLSGSPVPPSSVPNLMPRSVSAGDALGSRPGTSLSNVSSIDDLLGAPQARKGGTLKTRKKGRGYVDIMAK